ncbi:hypothetical protein HKBW3S42_00436 [Candidatus Hakubella thermalkaliphila]|nr:hypothetical protein [Candidatus Hakubella thermalkaliphila]GFP20269.1 hypothetical protein HKBW3S03_01771 [Candidatus Hakubella thermalkaliphila]GFP23202.1 hypothetical protein HKBW3S09_00669 [Candidatus Hakubella thermalkaliphila]GFP29510.1 hypothetical protein HKBW3S34_00430 [Candidatus Hakubella thermalkaliphila]GFP32131.1 hypothetical protein HKBW3S42_00436 [Candidatus Hakubella thermalkaliphila]GFP38683.1 hypothetical protein HKBW3S47_00384 [Candidatus Hakubella thermalkaliphila]
MKLQSSRGRTLHGDVVILNTSEIADYADYGGMLYELKKVGVRDGEAYQIDNCGDLLMYRDAYGRCKHILEKFGVKALCD